jgi:hypothetical protein
MFSSRGILKAGGTRIAKVPVMNHDLHGWMDPESEAREDELGAEFGDPRRCPIHPHVVTSSPDGMFDCPCGECEYASEMAYQEIVPVPTETQPVVPTPRADDDELAF